MPIIAFDSHKHYTQACVETDSGARLCEERIPHHRGALREFLARWPQGSPVAVETLGNWYWIVDEIEAAGMQPRLVHARKAKLMLGAVNKTDKLDARGINRLQRVGTLPTVWIPPAELRDKRELCRVRMVFSRQSTRLKNRIHSIIAKYGLQDLFDDVSDIFGVKACIAMKRCIKQVPEHTRYVLEELLAELDVITARLEAIDKRIRQVYRQTPEVKLLQTLYGIGPALSVVVAQEIGDLNRFPDAERFASYAGTCPRIHSSGDKTRYGKLRSDVNHYLKWAFCEAGNTIARYHKRYPNRHVTRLYARILHKRGHSKAVGAVARHLAEAAYWMLRKQQPYCEPKGNITVSSTAV
jgi:transposase